MCMTIRECLVSDNRKGRKASEKGEGFVGVFRDSFSFENRVRPS
jgi:hypothetical protein